MARKTQAAKKVSEVNAVQNACALNTNPNASVIKLVTKTTLDTSKLKDTLPNKPSDLLAAAVKDLKAASKMKGVTIDMGSYLAASEDSNATCTVCMAGSMLLGTMGLTALATTKVDFGLNGEELDILSIKDLKLRLKFMAVDAFRQGNIYDGIVQTLFLHKPEYKFGYNSTVEEVRLNVEDTRKLLSMIERSGYLVDFAEECLNADTDGEPECIHEVFDTGFKEIFLKFSKLKGKWPDYGYKSTSNRPKFYAWMDSLVVFLRAIES